jgi:hypothetical protein
MFKCVICEHWFDESEYDQELAQPTCKSCGEVERG